MDLSLKMLRWSGLNLDGHKAVNIFLQIVIVYSVTILGIIRPFLTENASIDVWASAFDSVVMGYEWSFKLIIYKIYGDSLRELKHSIYKDFWQINSVDKKTEKLLLKLTKRFSKAYKYYVVAVFLTFLIPYFQCLITITSKRILPLELYEIVDFTKFPYFEIFIILIGILIYVVITFTVAFDGLFFSFVFNAGIQFKLLQKFLDNSENIIKNDKDFVKKFVDHHSLLIRFMNKINYVYSNYLLLQISSNILAICLPIYLFAGTSGNVIKFLSFASTSSLQLLIYCVSGSEIIKSMENITNAIYYTDWLSPNRTNLRNGLIFILQRSQNNPALKIGKVVNLDLPLFVSVMRLSISFFALMQSVEK